MLKNDTGWWGLRHNRNCTAIYCWVAVTIVATSICKISLPDTREYMYVRIQSSYSRPENNVIIGTNHCYRLAYRVCKFRALDVDLAGDLQVNSGQHSYRCRRQYETCNEKLLINLKCFVKNNHYDIGRSISTEVAAFAKPCLVHGSYNVSQQTDQDSKRTEQKQQARGLHRVLLADPSNCMT